ncbi:MAG: peptide-binding protein [Thermodesulfobacteriota bacterium]
MTRSGRWLIALGGLILMLWFLGSCTRPEAPPVRDTLVLAFPYEPASLNPVFLSDQLSYTVSGWISPGLVRQRGDLTLVGDLAASWEILSGGREIRFHLRPGVTWHNGRDLTPEDVVYTYQLVTSGQIPTPHRSHFGPVQEVKALDRHTVSVKYQEIYSSALESWTIGLLQHPARNQPGPEEPGQGRAPVGAGPYRVRDWVAGQKIVLEAFPGYYGGTPKIRRLILKITPDPTTSLWELKSGSIDVMELTPSQYAQLSRNPDLEKKFRSYRCPSVRYGFLGFNFQDARFQDRRVRQALSLAIDKNAIIRSVLKGCGSPSTGPFPPGTWYYYGDVASYEYDPAKAKELLDGVGWYEKPGSISKEEQPGLNLVTNFENKENILIAEIIQNNLKKIGIKVKIEALEWLTFRYRIITRKAFDLVLLSRHYIWDPDLYNVWHSSKTREGEWNFLSYDNRQVDELLERGRKTIAKPERQLIYRKIQEIMAQDPPCVFLYNADGIFIAKKNIQGISPSPLGIFHDISSWSLDGKVRPPGN